MYALAIRTQTLAFKEQARQQDLNALSNIIIQLRKECEQNNTQLQKRTSANSEQGTLKFQIPICNLG